MLPIYAYFYLVQLLKVWKFNPELETTKEPTCMDVAGRHETKILKFKFYQFNSENTDNIHNLTQLPSCWCAFH